MRIRVVLVDDQDLVRAGFAMLLESRPEFEVVGEADDGDSALDLLTSVAADVVLMDVRMPRMSGVEATRRLVERGDAPKILMLTTYDLDEYAYEALAAGAGGFLLKDTPLDELTAAIRHVHDGDAVVAPSTTRRLIEHMTGGRPPSDQAGRTDSLERLTHREREVLELIARGLSNAEIAAEFVISEGTVKVHVGRILHKLGLRDRVQAVVLAYETGLVRPS